MLTSFFKKSNPVNFLILGFLILIGFIFGGITQLTEMLDTISVLQYAGVLMVVIFSMLILDFVIKKNDLNKPNSYGVFFFACFLIMLPIVFLQWQLVFANLFLLLALRRIMSLRVDKYSEKKILDASIWISVAALFYFWSFLFFVPLWIAIIQKPNVSYKQLLIPFTGFFAIMMIAAAWHLLKNDSLIWFFEWKKSISMDFGAYNRTAVFLPATLLISFMVWMGGFRILRLTKMSLKAKPNYMLMLYVLATCFFIGIASHEKTGAEVLFIMAPLAIIAANYIEIKGKTEQNKTDKTEYWFKEGLLWMVLVLPFVLMFI